MSDRWEMLLSPGTVTLPDRGGAGVKVIGAGWSEEAVTRESVAKAEKLRPAFDSAVPLWQGAPRFADDVVVPRDFCLSTREKDKAGHGQG